MKIARSPNPNIRAGIKSVISHRIKIFFAFILALAVHALLLPALYTFFKNDRERPPAAEKKDKSIKELDLQKNPEPPFKKATPIPQISESKPSVTEEKVEPPHRKRLAFVSRIKRRRKLWFKKPIEVKKESKKPSQLKPKEKKQTNKKVTQRQKAKTRKTHDSSKISRALKSALDRVSSGENQSSFYDNNRRSAFLPSTARVRVARATFYVGRNGVPYYNGQPLKRTRDGGWLYMGPKGTFAAKIYPDGSLIFSNRRSIFLGCAKGAKGCRKGITTLPSPSDPRNGSIRDNGGVVVSVSGGFDITDAIMKRRGGGPYREEKRKFMLATRAFRWKMRKARKGRALNRIQKQIDALRKKYLK